MDAAAKRRRWTVDLALGRRWWLLPVVVIAVPAMFRIYAEVSGYNWGQPKSLVSLDTIAFAVYSGMSGVPYAAAVLNAPGAQLRHRAAGLAALVIGILISSPHLSCPTYPFAFIALAGIQLVFASFLRWPRWRIGLDSTDSLGTSVAQLMSYTAGVALFTAAAIKWFDAAAFGSLPRIIAVTLALWLFAQYMGSTRHRYLALLAGLCFALAVAIPLGIEIAASAPRFQGISMMIMIHGLVLLPPWAICYFNRCDRGWRAVQTIADTAIAAKGTAL